MLLVVTRICRSTTWTARSLPGYAMVGNKRKQEKTVLGNQGGFFAEKKGVGGYGIENGGLHG